MSIHLQLGVLLAAKQGGVEPKFAEAQVGIGERTAELLVEVGS